MPTRALRVGVATKRRHYRVRIHIRKRTLTAYQYDAFENSLESQQ